jgi:inhibitor of KinA sporulation pathway (predicted exonuclease)
MNWLIGFEEFVIFLRTWLPRKTSSVRRKGRLDQQGLKQDR